MKKTLILALLAVVGVANAEPVKRTAGQPIPQTFAIAGADELRPNAVTSPDGSIHLVFGHGPILPRPQVLLQDEDGKNRLALFQEVAQKGRMEYVLYRTPADAPNVIVLKEGQRQAVIVTGPKTPDVTATASVAGAASAASAPEAKVVGANRDMSGTERPRCSLDGVKIEGTARITCAE
ncbi:hypothetical protein [Burkholderia cepacia]|uniref:hypothetical protein n=1 Tax=Burkholderia cepacia TaxID=292 RepID=UPI0026E10107|nr:hypothetical protein [Burkholderia cepacia]MDO5947171.1 hypothetical protein [Burkholderia cepacia]